MNDDRRSHAAGRRSYGTATATATRNGWLIGALVLALYVLLMLFASRLAPFDASELAGPSLARPGGRHLLGTNLLGQDIASQLLLGVRASVLVAVLAGTGTVLLGTLVGVLAGWFPAGRAPR